MAGVEVGGRGSLEWRPETERVGESTGAWDTLEVESGEPQGMLGLID